MQGPPERVAKLKIAAGNELPCHKPIVPHAAPTAIASRPVRSRSAATSPGRTRASRSLSTALVTRSCRGTSAPKCATFRISGRGSAQNSARENHDLASDFASLQFSKRPSENAKRREVAAHACFTLAKPTRLEPATSGVTGRRANLPALRFTSALALLVVTFMVGKRAGPVLAMSLITGGGGSGMLIDLSVRRPARS